MGKTKKSYRAPFWGFNLIIATRVGCTSQYVGKVLHGNLGKYTDRDTELVKQIHAQATEIEQIFKPQK